MDGFGMKGGRPAAIFGSFSSVRARRVLSSGERVGGEQPGLCRQFGISPTTGYKWVAVRRSGQRPHGRSLPTAAERARPARARSWRPRCCSAGAPGISGGRRDPPGGRERQGGAGAGGPRRSPRYCAGMGSWTGRERETGEPHPLRACLRSVADGLQGLDRAGAGALPSTDGAGRSPPYALELEAAPMRPPRRSRAG